MEEKLNFMKKQEASKPEKKFEGEKEEFNHEEHMEKVKRIATAIMETSEIEEAHQLAKELLQEETKEEKIEGGSKSLYDTLMASK